MTYWVINLARDLKGRTRRWNIPGPARRVLLLCDGAVRVVRGRPVEISEATLQKYASQLKAYQDNGSIEIRCTNTLGPVYDFGSRIEVPFTKMSTEKFEKAEEEKPKSQEPAPEPPAQEAAPASSEVESSAAEVVEEKEDDQPKSLDKMSKPELVEWLAAHTDKSAEEWSNYTRKKLIKEAKGLEK